MDFRCLFCMEGLKDYTLVCTATCDHWIHEECVENMKLMGDHCCKLCEKNIKVESVYKEFDLQRATQIYGVPLIVSKMDEAINMMRSHETQATAMKNKYDQISDKLERLAIENRAIKFEKHEAEQRIKKLEEELGHLKTETK